MNITILEAALQRATHITGFAYEPLSFDYDTGTKVLVYTIDDGGYTISLVDLMERKFDLIVMTEEVIWSNSSKEDKELEWEARKEIGKLLCERHSISGAGVSIGLMNDMSDLDSAILSKDINRFRNLLADLKRGDL